MQIIIIALYIIIANALMQIIALLCSQCHMIHLDFHLTRNALEMHILYFLLQMSKVIRADSTLHKYYSTCSITQTRYLFRQY